jgi:glycosyltransferase involved in cell wall biosynthesis
MTCFRFLQRLKLALRNWCHQDLDLPFGTFEVLIVNPESPDGTHEHLASVARSFPHIRVQEIAVGAELSTNKGAMINRAFEASSGEWIWLTDADCLFPPSCVATVLQQVEGKEQHLFYGQRRRLTAAQTDAVLTGRTDGLHDFAELAAAANLRTDDIFVDDCRRHQISLKQVEGLFCLHIEHPFAWYGTKYFL